VKAFLFVGLIIFGMIATEGVVTEEYGSDEYGVEEYGVEEDNFESSCDGVEIDSPSDIGEDEIPVCFEEDGPLYGSDVRG